jgi:hypothetical protein
VVNFAVCMRSHGVPNFPDASSTPGGGVSVIPSSFGAYRRVIRRGGAFLAIPTTINPASPAYQHAAAACRSGPRFS